MRVGGCGQANLDAAAARRVEPEGLLLLADDGRGGEPVLAHSAAQRSGEHTGLQRGDPDVAVELGAPRRLVGVDPQPQQTSRASTARPSSPGCSTAAGGGAASARRPGRARRRCPRTRAPTRRRSPRHAAPARRYRAPGPFRSWPSHGCGGWIVRADPLVGAGVRTAPAQARAGPPPPDAGGGGRGGRRHARPGDVGRRTGARHPHRGGHQGGRPRRALDPPGPREDVRTARHRAPGSRHRPGRLVRGPGRGAVGRLAAPSLRPDVAGAGGPRRRGRRRGPRGRRPHRRRARRSRRPAHRTLGRRAGRPRLRRLVAALAAGHPDGGLSRRPLLRPGSGAPDHLHEPPPVGAGVPGRVGGTRPAGPRAGATSAPTDPPRSSRSPSGSASPRGASAERSRPSPTNSSRSTSTEPPPFSPPPTPAPTANSTGRSTTGPACCPTSTRTSSAVTPGRRSSPETPPCGR